MFLKQVRDGSNKERMGDFNKCHNVVFFCSTRNFYILHSEYIDDKGDMYR